MSGVSCCYEKLHYITGIWQTLLSRATYNKVYNHNEEQVSKTLERSTVPSAGNNRIVQLGPCRLN
uniref:Uncharacterized protein n=1 Tax=Anguilla anguilla TaxID=7936 RepID=A0A0E9TL77_ANGAN